MRKSVNGRVIEIGNIGLFEKAFEGLALSRTASNSIINKSGLDLNTVSKYIELYNSFYKSLPFPLYALDVDAKYAAIGSYIKEKASSETTLWVDNGLYVYLGDTAKIAINFINNTWGLVRTHEIKADNTSMDRYKHSCGGEELAWALNSILSGAGTQSYYARFMGDFVKACDGDPLVLRRELSKILEFSYVPSRYNFQTNKIIDTSTKDEYMLDMYVSGRRKSEEKQHVWSLLDDESTANSFGNTQSKYVNQYDYELYHKQTDKKQVKLEKDSLIGASSLFHSLCGIRTIVDSNCFEDYTGILCDSRLVYEVDKRIFVTKAYRFSEPLEIASGFKLYAYDRGLLYLINTEVISSGVRKETIYACSVVDNSMRLCQIKYVRGQSN